jgi:hypothetical protein
MAVAVENELAYSRFHRGAALFEQAASSPAPTTTPPTAAAVSERYTGHRGDDPLLPKDGAVVK